MIPDEDHPKYITIGYRKIAVDSINHFYFMIGYLDEDNIFQINYYRLFVNEKNIENINNITVSNLELNSKKYTFLNKGINCDTIKTSGIGYMTCFIIGKLNNEIENNEYLIPLIFNYKDTTDNYKINFDNNSNFPIEPLNINNIVQIKIDTDKYIIKAHVCYVTQDNIGACKDFDLSSGFTHVQNFTKPCRADVYGMKVNYVFELDNTNDETIFSCSDNDGSIQVYLM